MASSRLFYVVFSVAFDGYFKLYSVGLGSLT